MLWGGNIVSVARLTGLFPEQTTCGKWTIDVVFVSVLSLASWCVGRGCFYTVTVRPTLSNDSHLTPTMNSQISCDSPWSNVLQHTTQGPMGKFHTPTSSQLQPLSVCDDHGCCRPDTFWTWTCALCQSADNFVWVESGFCLWDVLRCLVPLCLHLGVVQTTATVSQSRAQTSGSPVFLHATASIYGRSTCSVVEPERSLS